MSNLIHNIWFFMGQDKIMSPLRKIVPRLLIVLIAGIIIFPTSTVSAQAGQTWYLENVTFSNGARAFGSFDYDATTNTYSNIDISVFDSPSYGTVMYGVRNTSSLGNATTLIMVEEVLPDMIGVLELGLGFASPLTNAGGTINIELYPTGFSVQGTCNTTTCTGINSPFDFPNGGRVTTVAPVEALTLTINSSSISENGGVSTATVTRNVISGNLTVNLSSNDTGEATVPATIAIADGEIESAPFNITAVDDGIIDGTQTVTISASASGYTSANDTIDVTPECTGATISTFSEFNAALSLYNNNCGDGETLTITVDGTITLGSAPSDIDNSTTAILEIVGDDAATDILDGANSFRILEITDGNVTLDTMTLQNGLADGAATADDNGGAITNSGSLTLINSIVTSNQATENGGALWNNGSLSITDSTLSSNSSQFGGAIYNGVSGNLTVSNSTFNINSVALGNGGAIYNEATVDIFNSTYFANTAGNGGAIWNSGFGVLTLTNSTLSGNGANNGGGIENRATLNLNNSILANSTNGTDCRAFGGGIGKVTFSPETSNLIETDGASSNACGTAVTDYISADPLLGPLQDNGGDVETMALGAGSLAINAGDNTAATGLTTDARGTGFLRQVAGTVDLGAFENQQTTSVEFASTADSGVESVANPTILILTTSDGEVSVAAITVELAVSGGTLTDDYTVTTPFTIPAGTASGTPFAIPGFAIVDDSVEEADETLTLTLSNPSGATLGAQTTIDYTILDDDRVPPAPFTADVLSVVVLPLEDASNIGGIFYNFPSVDSAGDNIVLQGGQTNARIPVLSEILEASVPPGVGSSIGQTAWRSLPGTPPSTGNPVDNRVVLYIDPNDLLGTAAFSVEDITSVEWRTNRQADTSGVDVDWYALEYTAVTKGGSTVSRITAETLYSAGGNPPANNGTWQTWDTLNVPLFEPVQAGTTFGWFGNNVFQNDFFAGPIDWSLEASSGSSVTIDYRPEIINTIAIATASSWSDDLDGYIDYLVFNIDDGSTSYELIVDLEASPVPNEPIIEKTFGSDTIDIGTTTTLTFTLTNPNSSPLSGLAFSDTLPTNGGTGTMTFTSLTPTIDTCTTVRGITSVTADEISVSDVYLTGGASCEIVLEVEVDEVGTYDNISSALTTTTIGTAFGIGTDTAVAALEVVPPASPCIDVTVINQTELEDALNAYNVNCGNGDTLTATVDGTIILTSALSQVDNNTTAQLVIAGDGDDIIDGADSFGILSIIDGDVTIDTMTLQNGLSDNGGAIYVDSGDTLAVMESLFTGNNTTSEGGAIFSSGGSVVTIDNSTFTDNSTAARGGAILVRNASIKVSNSTFTGNTSGANGGAILVATNATATVTNSTLSGNSAVSGGAIMNDNGGTLNLNNSILANSTTGTDCYDNGGLALNFSAGTSNLIETDAVATNACGTAGTNYISVDPLLGPLQDNGGSIETMALLSGSSAINAGDNASAVDANSNPLTTDARGVGFPRIVNGTVDLGAWESQQTTEVAFTAASSSGAESVTNPIILTITTLDSSATMTDITIELAVSGGTLTEDYTVTTPFTIPAGTSPGTIAIPDFAIVDDNVAEPDETLTLTLSNPSGAVLGAQTTIAYTIENDDIEEYLTFLPIIMKPAYPDLIVEDVTVSNTDITVVIRNIGIAPVTNGFYVDVYLGLLNAAQPPTGVNDIWQNVSPQGVVWGIDASITPIAPSETVTLTLNDSYQLDAYTDFTLPWLSGTAVYVQVDSAHVDVDYGAVLESHEITNTTYNNIVGPVLAP